MGAWTAACGSGLDAPSEGASDDVFELPQPLGTAAAATANPSPSSSSSAEPEASGRCDEFKPRYIGNGLTVSVPEAAIFTVSESTADLGPIHSGTSTEFTFDGFVAVVGRRIGSDIVPEDGFDQRVENGVVLFVKAADPELRSCLLETVHYDAVQDEQDE